MREKSSFEIEVARFALRNDSIGSRTRGLAVVSRFRDQRRELAPLDELLDERRHTPRPCVRICERAHARFHHCERVN